MRLNQYLARGLGISRRLADQYIRAGRVQVNGTAPAIHYQPLEADKVCCDGRPVIVQPFVYLILHKPTGYVCSRRRQGHWPTIYQLLPERYSHLKSAGRLDRESSGLLLLTDDGDLIYQLTHPKFAKSKLYHVRLDQPLSEKQLASINAGLMLEDGPSRMQVTPLGRQTSYQIIMQEGRKRQIRRSMLELGRMVLSLKRLTMGGLSLGRLAPGQWRILESSKMVANPQTPLGLSGRMRK